LYFAPSPFSFLAEAAQKSRRGFQKAASSIMRRGLSQMADTAKKIRSCGLAALSAALVIGGAFHVLYALTNPVLLINKIQAEVLVDGSEVPFTRGTARFSPWKRSYVVEIRSVHGRHKRRVYPWESDSPSIAVDRSGVQFHIVSIEAD
jgi:hypothetical protein